MTNDANLVLDEQERGQDVGYGEGRFLDLRAKMQEICINALCEKEKLEKIGVAFATLMCYNGDT